VDEAWSLTERPGYLRLKTARVVPNLYLAPNTITQRMEGPVCSGYICMDLSKMKDGDCAGLTAFNGDSGVLTVKKSGKKLTLEMSEQNVSLSNREKAVTKVDEKVIETIDITKLVNAKQPKIWLRLDGDFRPGQRGSGHDAANFYYSFDGEQWEQIGTENYRMIFDYRRFFMGSKFGIFNYATKKTGGYVDVDYFHYQCEEK
jgi:beta-xylosidase